MATGADRRFATDSDRLEAFSDGVIAVIITIMVLDLHAPAGAALRDLRGVAPTFFAYVLSFVFIGIYWNNHHHLLRATKGIDGRAMWANLHLLFWLSLAPFATAWLGAHPTEPGPTAAYGAVLLLDAIAYSLLQRTLEAINGPESAFTRALRAGWKGRGSLLLYALAIAAAFVVPAIADAIFVAVAVIWLVPDRRLDDIIALRD